jgi:hypothetical protein
MRPNRSAGSSISRSRTPACSTWRRWSVSSSGYCWRKSPRHSDRHRRRIETSEPYRSPQRFIPMLILALLTGCALLPGSLALDEAIPLAPCTSHAVAYALLRRTLMITAYNPDRHPDRCSLTAEEWPECADDQESEEFSGDEDGQTPSLADLLWLPSSELRGNPHPERPTRSVHLPKPLSILRC